MKESRSNKNTNKHHQTKPESNPKRKHNPVFGYSKSIRISDIRLERVIDHFSPSPSSLLVFFFLISSFSSFVRFSSLPSSYRTFFCLSLFSFISLFLLLLSRVPPPFFLVVRRFHFLSYLCVSVSELRISWIRNSLMRVHL